ncbi:MAG: hypothetical protein WKG01_23285 [Kofleriaceae bacterium]
MRFLILIFTPWLATLAFWFLFVACIDQPMPPSEPLARILTIWDPLACGEPHRVVIELEDEDGENISGSTPCAVGSLALDAPHLGVYWGRIYAWQLEADPQMRSVMPFRLAVDDPVVRGLVATPR